MHSPPFITMPICSLGHWLWHWAPVYIGSNASDVRLGVSIRLYHCLEQPPDATRMLDRGRFQHELNPGHMVW